MLKSSFAQTVVAVFILIGLGFFGRGCWDESHKPVVITGTIHRIDTTVTSRPDSQEIKLSLILPKAEIKGRANRVDTVFVADGQPTEFIVGLDTVGYFGKDSLQVAPDTANIRYNLQNSEFGLWYSFGARSKDTLVRYVVRDSLIHDSDSTTLVRIASRVWYEQPLLVLSGTVLSAVVFTILKVIFHI